MIAEKFPQIAEFIDWHLCDVHGIPMHYVANSVYHLQQGKKEFFESTALINRIGFAESDAFDSLFAHWEKYQDENHIKNWLKVRIPYIKEAFNKLLDKHGFKKPEGY